MNDTIQKIADDSGTSTEVVSTVLGSLAKVAYRSATDGFVLPGFGEFVVYQEEGRKGINPFTGEPTVFRGKKVVEFQFNESARQAFLAGERGSSLRTQSDLPPNHPRLPKIRMDLNKEDLRVATLTRVFEPGTSTKLGGEPDWIQGDDTPNCVGCGRAMQFYAQIDSAFAEEFYIGDVGRLYVFRCEDCWHAQTVMQCS